MATVDHWSEWKKQCAIALCGDEARHNLELFAWQRWTRFLEITLGYDAPELRELRRSDVWHQFETWCCVGPTAAEKSHKDWIFKRLETHSGSGLDIIQSGATLVLRDAVRDFIRHEGRTRLPGTRSPEKSLDEPVAGSEEGGNLTYGDLLPGELDTASMVSIREYQRLGEEEALKLSADLRERERLVLAASALGIPMSHPRLEQITRKKKSVLSAALQSVEARVTRHIDKKYGDEKEGSRRILSAATLQRLRNLSCDPKNSPETWRDELFKLLSMSS